MEPDKDRKGIEKGALAFLEALKKRICSMDRQKWLVVILLGVLLLVVAMPVKGRSSLEMKNGLESKTAHKEEEEQEEEVGENYETKMERRLEKLLSQMDGVGKVQVMITLENQGEKVVAQDVSSTSSTSNSGGDSATQRTESREEISKESKTVLAEDYPYETKAIEPEIRGVCVVAEGAGNDTTRVEIYKAIQALFAIDAHKISIVEMGSQEGS